jgi:hypothetical protein
MKPGLLQSLSQAHVDKLLWRSATFESARRRGSALKQQSKSSNRIDLTLAQSWTPWLCCQWVLSLSRSHSELRPRTYTQAPSSPPASC